MEVLALYLLLGYLETHWKHNDKGYVVNKILFLKQLNTPLVLGFHGLAIPKRKPYTEVTIGLDNLGFGKLKMALVKF